MGYGMVHQYTPELFSFRETHDSPVGLEVSMFLFP